MSRNISNALKAHLAGSVTHTCRLLRVTLEDGRTFGMTTHDQNIKYDGTDFIAINGFNNSIIATDSGLTVDNSEAYALLSAEVPGISIEMVERGEMDGATWEMLLINYRDLSMGHIVLDCGDIGEINIEDGVVYIPELLSFAIRLRKSIGTYWQRRCRAVFGSPANSQTGCGVDTSTMWTNGSVTAVTTEPNYTFVDTAIVIPNTMNTARIRWTSGKNQNSKLYQIEGYDDATKMLSIAEATPFPIAVGDTYQIRADCDKSPANCAAYNNFLNYKGEPLIPVSDSLSVLTPSAGMSGGFIGG